MIGKRPTGTAACSSNLYLEGGTFFNAELVKQGYAHAYTKYPFKYLEEFREYEQEARLNGRGLWGEKRWR